MEIKRRSSIKDEKFKPNIIAITNRKESSIGRQVSNIVDICAGIEVGVVAIKTFLHNYFYGLAIKFAQIKESQTPDEIDKLISELIQLPHYLKIYYEHNKSSESWHMIFLIIEMLFFRERYKLSYSS